MGRRGGSRLAGDRADSARKLTACRRELVRLGASRVVGLNPRIVYDRDTHSTFDELRVRVNSLNKGRI